MSATTNESPAIGGAHTVDQIKSYVLRTDSIAPCCVADVHSVPQALKDIEAYWLGTVPCRTVRLVGILVSAIEYESRSVYSVDDGTGAINCIKKRPVRLEASQLVDSAHVLSRQYDIGDVVSVVGKIQDYREQRQIFVSSIDRCLSPDEEAQHMIEVLKKHRTRYSQPFTMPPLPVPATPPKRPRPESQPNYAASVASTPTTAGLSSPTRSPAKDHSRFRHPSRLRSKDLNDNVFRIYIAHIMISTLTLPEPPLGDPALLPEDTGSTPRPSRIRSNVANSDTTPRHPGHVGVDVVRSPTPKKAVTQYPLAPVSRTSSDPPLGVTLSYLRRVKILSELAERVVDQAAHERDKMLRQAERNARTKYEESCPPPAKQPKLAKSGSSPRSKSASSSARTASSIFTKYPQSSSRAASAQSASSSRVSSSTKSPSRAKVQRAETLAPAEAARRAAYHSKQSKLRAEDAVKRPARTKRLFESALRTLVSEGQVVLHYGPKRYVPSSDKSRKRPLPMFSGIWPDVTNTVGVNASRSMSTASSMLSGQITPDLETISEDDDQANELSEPSDSEDAYLPVTPQVLRPVLLAALRETVMRNRAGVEFAGWVRALRGDDQWAKVPEVVLREVLGVLREEDWVYQVGNDRWDFTRGSWSKSLTLS